MSEETEKEIVASLPVSIVTAPLTPPIDVVVASAVNWEPLDPSKLRFAKMPQPKAPEVK